MHFEKSCLTSTHHSFHAVSFSPCCVLHSSFFVMKSKSNQSFEGSWKLDYRNYRLSKLTTLDDTQPCSLDTGKLIACRQSGLPSPDAVGICLFQPTAHHALITPVNNMKSFFILAPSAIYSCQTREVGGRVKLCAQFTHLQRYSTRLL